MKRAFDAAFSAVAMVILSPLLLVLAVAVKLSSPGPCFYRGLRIGWHGTPFKIIKFRSMIANAEHVGGPCTASDDPRITPAGRFLRRYKLDELPQLFNVLKGDMSIVGPRPEVAEYVSLYTPEEREILSVRPGITDWATLWNPDEEAALAGAANPEKVYRDDIRPEKLRLQLKYVRNHSFRTDMGIVARTMGLVISRAFAGERSKPGYEEAAKNRL